MKMQRIAIMSVPLTLAGAMIAGAGCGQVWPPEETPSRGTLAPQTATPTIAQIPVEVSSGTPGPTTAVPTAPTQTSIPASSAALEPRGPWLLGVGGGDQLSVLNPDGTGLTAVEHQPLWDTYPDIRLGVEISNAGWIAVRTSASTWPDPPSDMSLDLFRLPGVRPTRRIPLFSQALVARMGDIGEHTQPYEEQPVEGPNWRYEMAYLAVLSERNPPRWSPDSRYLAFVGAIDGPSSDLYVYDTQTDQVRRLTDGPNQTAILGWSPDSWWLIHSEASTTMIADGGEIGGFPADAVWAAAADGSEVRRLYGPAGVESILGWVSDAEFLVERWSGYIFLHDLRVVDVSTGAERTLYPGDFYNSALAPGPRIAVVDAVSEWISEDEYFPGGLHLVPLDTAVPKPVRPGVEGFSALRVEWFPQLDQFLAGDFGVSRLFMPSGEITQTFQNETGWPAVSPDGSWLAFGGERERPGLRMYGADGQMAREISRENTHNFVWATDSSALYYLVMTADSNRLMVVPIPDGEPIQLHANPGLYRFVLVDGPKGSE